MLVSRRCSVLAGGRVCGLQQFSLLHTRIQGPGEDLVDVHGVASGSDVGVKGEKVEWLCSVLHAPVGEVRVVAVVGRVENVAKRRSKGRGGIECLPPVQV